VLIDADLLNRQGGELGRACRSSRRRSENSPAQRSTSAAPKQIGELFRTSSSCRSRVVPRAAAVDGEDVLGEARRRLSVTEGAPRPSRLSKLKSTYTDKLATNGPSGDGRVTRPTAGRRGTGGSRRTIRTCRTSRSADRGRRIPEAFIPRRVRRSCRPTIADRVRIMAHHLRR